MIEFRNVVKTYQNGTTAVSDLSFTAPTGKITTLVGPSGCGKTTSLRMINRLIEPTSGRILVGGEDNAIVNTIEMRRQIGYVIQNAGLFPHRTVQDNVCAVPFLLGEPKEKCRKHALELLELVGLDPSYATRYPRQLSGGQQQRVGVARALAADPPFMLMDEPFSAVDPIVRAQLQQEFLRIQQTVAKTIVMVTHDIDEALKLGDQVVVLKEGGVLAQVGTPEQLLTDPADEFVAQFLGQSRGYHALGLAHMTDLPLDPAAAVRINTPSAAPDGTWVVVLSEEGKPIGWAQSHGAHAPVLLADIHYSGTVAPITGTRRDLLDSVLTSPSKHGIVTDSRGVFLGVISAADALAEALSSAEAAH